MPRISEIVKAFNDLHWPQDWKKWKSERTIRGLRRVVCPNCGNDDMETMCKLRNDFYECEKCKRKFDKDIV